MKALCTWLLAAAALLLTTAFSATAADIPYLSGRVVDNAEVLSPAARERITAVLRAHEKTLQTRWRC